MQQVFLQQLLKLANDFYNKSKSGLNIKLGQGFTMPDDEEIPENTDNSNQDSGQYEDIVRMARQVDDPALASDLETIAAMYQDALKTGMGYNSIFKAINNLINLHLENEEDDNMGVEDLLNEVLNDIRRRAGGQAALKKEDSPETIARLKQIRDLLKNNTIEEQMKDLSEYENEEGGGLDPYTEMSAQEAGKYLGYGDKEKGIAPNWHIENAKRKDWVQSYKNERLRYSDLLEGEKDQTTRNNVEQLLDVLDQLVEKVPELEQLRGLQKVAPDPDNENKLGQFEQEVADLRKKRSDLRQKIRKTVLAKDQSKVNQELVGVRDPKEKMRLEQEKALYDLLLSTDSGKRKEIAWRKLLLKSMSGGNFPGQDTLNKLLQNIQEASKERKTQEQARKEQALEKSKHFAYKSEFRRDKAISTEGITIQFKQSLPSIKMGIKKNITARLMMNEDIKYKPYKDKLNEANRSGNTALMESAKKELQKVLNADAENDPELKTFVAYTEGFYRFINEVGVVHKMADEGHPIPVEVMEKLVEMGNNLLTQELRRAKGKDNKLTTAIRSIVKEFNEQIRQLKPKQAGYSRKELLNKLSMETRMDQSARIKLLKKIAEIKEEKKSQPEGEDVNALAPSKEMDVDVENDFGHQVFMELLNNLKIKGLDE